MRYITWGPVRGTTGCLHKSIETARQAVARDQKRCARVGGYSDRAVYEVDVENGETWENVAEAYRFDPTSIQSVG